jgi:hypothetical protein
MAFAATYHAVEVALKQQTVFACHKSKFNAVVNGEYGFSRALLSANLNMDTLLMKYQSGVDWRDQRNWNCNGNMHPTRHRTYLADRGSAEETHIDEKRLTVHPLETVFYKPIWIHRGKVESAAYVEETWAYLEWAWKQKFSR